MGDLAPMFSVARSFVDSTQCSPELPGRWLDPRRASHACAAFVLASAIAHAESDLGIGATCPERVNAPPAEVQRAAALVRDMRLHEAVAILERLNERYPADPIPYNELAVIYARRGDLDRAQDLLVAAIEAEPRYALVYRNLQAIFRVLASRAYDEALFEIAGEPAPPALVSFAGRSPPLAAFASPAPDEA